MFNLDIQIEAFKSCFLLVHLSFCCFLVGLPVLTRKGWRCYPSCISLLVQICLYQTTWRYLYNNKRIQSLDPPASSEGSSSSPSKASAGTRPCLSKVDQIRADFKAMYDSQLCHCSFDDIKERSFTRRRWCCLVCH